MIRLRAIPEIQYEGNKGIELYETTGKLARRWRRAVRGEAPVGVEEGLGKTGQQQQG